jgi:hypothetical protein
MSTKAKLKQFSDEIKKEALAGKSMQKKLGEIVSRNDLTSHEIRRIAEMANRDAQLELYKTSSDKRFKFELADPSPFIKEQKTASTNLFKPVEHDINKLASEDPVYSVPYRAPKAFSLYDHTMNEKLAEEIDETETRKIILQLDKSRLEHEAILKQGEAQIIKLNEKAVKDYSKLVQSAMDLVMAGISLPSLYQAVIGANSGSRATDAEKDGADKIMALIIEGLKDRGVPNHKMGFRHQGRVADLDALGEKELLYLCKRSTGQLKERDITLPTAKLATVIKNAEYRLRDDSESEKYLSSRPAVVEHPCPQVYLDEKYTDNLPGGVPKVINGQHEFVIRVNDLMGDQSRTTRLHSANEYIGLKLKEIQEAIRSLRDAKVANFTPPKPGEGKLFPLRNKIEMAGTVLGLAAAGKQMWDSSKTSGFLKNLSASAKADPLNALGTGAAIVSAGETLKNLIAPPAPPQEEKRSV